MSLQEQILWRWKLTRCKHQRLILAALTAWLLDVLVFERSREIDGGKKLTVFVFEPVSRQTKLKSNPFNALFAWANKPTVRDYCNYGNDKETKAFFYFLFNTPSFFCMHFFLIKKKHKPAKAIMEWCFFLCQTSPSAKNKLNPARIENHPQSDIIYALFVRKPSIVLLKYFLCFF